ncbi:promotilin isoform X1 [Neofelis nebulosa]|uniref:promotilin isoform X1 n=1 Tax=Neofelis nebulosa TaxID=61452 RepID=UPI00272DB114|nr:promotilin isoform X1 [Neofelis nebulosa]
MSQIPKEEQRQTSPRMVSRKAVAVLLMVHVAVMLASQTEAFVPIFTHSELQRIREKERNKGQKKSLIVQQRSEEMGPLDPVEPTEEEENEVIKVSRQGDNAEKPSVGKCSPCQPQIVLEHSSKLDIQATSSILGEIQTPTMTQLSQIRHRIRRHDRG